MSLAGLFDIGKTGVYASQMALNVVAHNMSNVNTPNYTRQEVTLDTPTPSDRGAKGFFGRGVNIVGVRRNYDNFINNQLLGQTQNFGRSAALKDGLGQVEQVFNEARGAGLSIPLNDFFKAWNEVANNPEDLPQRNVLMQKASDLVSTVQKMEASLEDIVHRANLELEDVAERVNTVNANIADLNRRIKRAGGITGANDLIDDRDRLLNELGELVEFTSTEDALGQVTINVGRKNLVDREIFRPIEVQTDTSLDVHYMFEGRSFEQYIKKGRVGGLVELRDSIRSNSIQPLRDLMAKVVDTVNAQHQQGYGLDGVNGRDFFTPASSLTNPADIIKNMGLAISSVNEIGASLPTAGISSTFGSFSTDAGETVSFTIDGIALSFAGTGNPTADATAFYNALQNEQTTNGTLAGYTFADDGAGNVTVSLANPTNAPEAISITGWTGSNPLSDTSVSVTPVSGTLSTAVLLNDNSTGAGVASTALDFTLDTGIPGNNKNALAMSSLQVAAMTINGESGTFDHHYNTIVSIAGTKSRAAIETNNFDEVLKNDLKARRDEVSSVSLDEEAVDMVRFQRSFEASARMISVADELMQTVLQMV